MVTSPKTHILLAEDEVFLVEIYQRKLEDEGYKVSVANDGETALKIMLNENVELVLLDIMMPKMNGMEVLRKMQKNPKLNKIIPVVFSNLGYGKDVEKAKKLGAKEYIIKSNVTTKEVLVKIKSLLKNK